MTAIEADLRSLAEEHATRVERLPAFLKIKLADIKSEIASILDLIGRGGIFDQYSRHDISHINGMLAILDWLVPDKTKAAMSPADWLLTVLAIYFHDLGMVVTTREYERREESGFQRFCDGTLFAGPEGEDYRVRVNTRYRNAAERERFLYQEFVRCRHPQRIRNWIMGDPSNELGLADEAQGAVRDILAGLDDAFRRDLALVCESHHLDDLDNTQRYPVSQPYGNSDEETANVQYAAVLLRSADLLHITRDRTPAVAFRVINPSDPISQVEWAKQLAVRAVRPQQPRDKEGKASTTIGADTIEVHALFTNAEGFFGLTSYLAYADQQLKKSNEWCEATRKKEGVPHAFPWRTIDDSHIEAMGFLPKTFAFEIDQVRILDLLTGHTLYNDTDVVLRELVQNALDAVRLQALTEPASRCPARVGKVKIEWNSRHRTLSVTDNGTGMTQAIIERHLLRVGSSRYQDPAFREKYPTFSAISRFGIGVLSCFMIADEVEIVTCHPDEEQVRHLSLRSVHGRYLIRLLDKNDTEASGLTPHGTRVTLRLRPSAEVIDVLKAARKWIVVPECRVEVTVNGNAPEVVGHDSPKAALTDLLRTLGFTLSSDDCGTSPSHPGESLQDSSTVRVLEQHRGATTLAYAVQWSAYFKEWAFLEVTQHVRDRDARGDKLPFYLGTCVEGIRVEFGTPGYDGLCIAAIANASGPSAPKTNVARSNLDETSEYVEMLRSTYSIFSDHVCDELSELHTTRGFSLTWAAGEGQYLIAPLIDASIRSPQPLSPDVLFAELQRVPLLLVERKLSRSALSIDAIHSEPSFWTSEGEGLASAEQLLKEVPGTASLATVLQALGAPGFELPVGTYLASVPTSDALAQSTFKRKEVSRILVLRDQRRVDLEWSSKDEPPRWESPKMNLYRRLLRRGGRMPAKPFRRRHSLVSLYVPTREVEVSGLNGETAIRTTRGVFVLFGSGLDGYLRQWLKRLSDRPDREELALGITVFEFVGDVLTQLANETIEQAIQDLTESVHPNIVGSHDFSVFLEELQRTRWLVFDPWAWQRRASDDLETF